MKGKPFGMQLGKLLKNLDREIHKHAAALHLARAQRDAIAGLIPGKQPKHYVRSLATRRKISAANRARWAAKRKRKAA